MSNKKESYPKAMTIRYDELEEKQIKLMMDKMGKNTMTKAFLAAPEYLDMAEKRILSLQKQVNEQQDKIANLSEIVNHWQQLNFMFDKLLKGEKINEGKEQN